MACSLRTFRIGRSTEPMRINNMKKIGGSILGLLLFLGIMVMSSTTAQAQYPWYQDRDQQRRQQEYVRQRQRELQRLREQQARQGGWYDQYGNYPTALVVRRGMIVAVLIVPAANANNKLVRAAGTINTATIIPRRTTKAVGTISMATTIRPIRVAPTTMVTTTRMVITAAAAAMTTIRTMAAHTISARLL